MEDELREHAELIGQPKTARVILVIFAEFLALKL
jgi:hypothetical protein